MAYPMNAKTAKPSVTNPSTDVAGNKKNEVNWFKGLVTLIVILIIIGGGLYAISGYTGIGAGLIPGLSQFKATWQAVFLTNGQVYFGKVVKVRADSIVLRDIYYLQVVNQPLQRSALDDSAQDPEQRLTLIKLGNEIHGPVDEMTINRDHVVIIEDLKDDSRVVQAINDYITQQGQ